VQRAKEIKTTDHALSARDAVHLAVMEAHEIHRIMSFDATFDQRPGVQRLS
jgi:predicted nucleic acid-binding protein